MDWVTHDEAGVAEHREGRVGGGDVHADQTRKARDEKRDSELAAEIPPDIRPNRQEPERKGNEAHHLAEQRPDLVARDRLSPESCVVGGGLERAHVTTKGLEQLLGRSGWPTPAPSTMWN